MFLWLRPFHCSSLSQEWWITGRKELELPQHQTLPSHYICPRDAAVVLSHTENYCWGSSHRNFFFSFLNRAYFLPMIQRLRQPEPDRIVCFCSARKLVSRVSHWITNSDTVNCLPTDGTFTHSPSAVQLVTCLLRVLGRPQWVLTDFLFLII